jgi:ribonuclease HII
LTDSASRSNRSGSPAASCDWPVWTKPAEAPWRDRWSPPRSSYLAAAIVSSLPYAVGAASAREIDRLNIRRATALAMRRAVLRLPIAPDAILLDGLPMAELGMPHEALVGGDRRCYAIACASIVAKTVRDHLMRLLALRHPAFGWERNAGYGTPYHIAALARCGPTPHHRRSFAPLTSAPGHRGTGAP